MASSDVASSDVASSDVASSDVASSDVASSDVASSDVASSDVASSDVASSDVASSDLASSDLAGRVTLRGQSFFDPLPAGADLYLLKNVLNDWPDEQTVALLRRCAQAAPPGGRIAVLGGVAADEAPASWPSTCWSPAERPSTITEFTELARRAGLRITAAGTQASGRFVVECQPLAEREEDRS